MSRSRPSRLSRCCLGAVAAGAIMAGCALPAHQRTIQAIQPAPALTLTAASSSPA